MRVMPTSLPEIKLITPVSHQDERGYFVETYLTSRFAEAGMNSSFVQDNRALSRAAFTVRGLHFQTDPFAQDKLIWVARGSIFDVAVDLRPGSVSYGRHVAVTLDAASMTQIFIPAGFAHGYCTLEPDTEVTYKVSMPYSRNHDFGLRWNDPALGIDWPVDPDRAIVSARDQVSPLLAELSLG